TGRRGEAEQIALGGGHGQIGVGDLEGGVVLTVGGDRHTQRHPGLTVDGDAHLAHERVLGAWGQDECVGGAAGDLDVLPHAEFGARLHGGEYLVGERLWRGGRPRVLARLSLGHGEVGGGVVGGVVGPDLVAVRDEVAFAEGVEALHPQLVFSPDVHAAVVIAGEHVQRRGHRGGVTAGGGQVTGKFGQAKIAALFELAGEGLYVVLGEHGQDFIGSPLWQLIGLCAAGPGGRAGDQQRRHGGRHPTGPGS